MSYQTFWFLLLAAVCLQCAANALPVTGLTPAAQKMLAELVGMINDTIDPCDDFHEYVCSNEISNVAIKVGTTINEKIASFVKRPQKPTDGTAIKRYYKLYESCKTAEPELYSYEKEKGYNHLESVLYDLAPLDYYGMESGVGYGLWPIVLAEVAANAYLRGYNILMPLQMTVPIQNAEFIQKYDKILSIEKPTISATPLAYDQKNYPSYKQQVLEFFTKVYDEKVLPLLKKLRKDIAAEELTNFANEMVEMEAKVAALLLLNEEENHVEMTVGEAMEKMPQIDWGFFIYTLETYSGVKLTQNCKLEDCPIQFPYPNTTAEYLKILGRLKQSVYVPYAFTRVAMAVEQDPIKTVNNTINCEILTRKTFPLVKQYLYITEMYPTAEEREKLKYSVSQLVDNVIASVKNMIDKVPWIRNDPKTYAGFTAKMDKLTKVIAYPDHLLNQTWLDEQYKDFDRACGDECMTTTYEQYRTAHKYMARKVLSVTDVGSADYLTFNAFYAPSYNKFLINIAILHPMLYHPDLPLAMKYGSLGTTIGHEIFHGFDITGIKYGADGHLQKWMSDYSTEKLHLMTQCLVDEYNQFELYDNGTAHHVDGRLTLGENMADNAGIQASYQAFKNDPASNNPLSVPGFKDLTNEKLFFLTFARFFCKGETIADGIRALGDPHPPHRTRIPGVLKNFVPFREAFKCPVNSYYAPEKHCEVYTSKVL